MKNSEGRADHELEAVRNIINYFNSNGYNRQIKYIETAIDFSNLCFVPIKDTETIAFMSAAVLRDRRYKKINDIIVTHIATDEVVSNPNVDWAISRRGILKTVLGREYTEHWPLKTMYKSAIIKAMPDDLFKLTHYCRRPKQDGTNCDRCETCKQVAEVIK
jgi:7-cyano-7-deazaguanine synthase in queuosine biosynthesis